MTPLQAALEAGKLTEEERDDNIEVGSKGTVTVDAVGLSEDAHAKLTSHLAWWFVENTTDGDLLIPVLESLNIEKPTEVA